MFSIPFLVKTSELHVWLTEMFKIHIWNEQLKDILTGTHVLIYVKHARLFLILEQRLWHTAQHKECCNCNFNLQLRYLLNLRCSKVIFVCVMAQSPCTWASWAIWRQLAFYKLITFVGATQASWERAWGDLGQPGQGMGAASTKMHNLGMIQEIVFQTK